MEVDTQKDSQFYLHLVDLLGDDKASELAPPIFAEDLNWMGWEVCRSSAPKAFFYKIIKVEDEVRLVNQRDFLDSEDILKKIDKDTRRGLEYSQMNNVRLRLLSAENGAIASWVSPKKMLPEDPEYPLDQINIAKKIDEETILVKQLQGDFTPEYLADMVHSRTTKLSDLMMNIGDTEVYNLQFTNDNQFTVNNDQLTIKAKEYVTALRQGLSADSLRVKRADLLRDTIPYIYSGSESNTGVIFTSCGTIDFGYISPNKSEVWAKIDYKNREFTCDFCWRTLPLAWLNSHRCVC